MIFLHEFWKIIYSYQKCMKYISKLWNIIISMVYSPKQRPPLLYYGSFLSGKVFHLEHNRKKWLISLNSEWVEVKNSFEIIYIKYIYIYIYINPKSNTIIINIPNLKHHTPFYKKYLYIYSSAPLIRPLKGFKILKHIGKYYCLFCVQ